MDCYNEAVQSLVTNNHTSNGIEMKRCKVYCTVFVLLIITPVMELKFISLITPDMRHFPNNHTSNGIEIKLGPGESWNKNLLIITPVMELKLSSICLCDR